MAKKNYAALKRHNFFVVSTIILFSPHAETLKASTTRRLLNNKFLELVG
jgi:hypothetical protein